MNRRKFLGLLAGTAAAVALPIPAFQPEPEHFGDYCDYVNFSEFAITADIAPETVAAAKILARDMAAEIEAEAARWGMRA